MNSIHSQIYRTKEILGVSIPGIIYNGSYFFVDLGVYEDGRVECWNFEDFEHFKNDVNCGWVSVNIPDGEEISVQGLGSWKIDQGNWNYSKQSFIDYVYSLVKILNPKLENLYTYSERKVNGLIIAESGSGKTFKEKKAGPTDLFPTKEVGKSVNLFFKAKDQRYYLSKLEMYAEDALVLNRIPEPFEFDLSQLEEMISSQKILADLPPNAKVEIDGLGSFIALECMHQVGIEEKLSEIKDTLRVMSGGPSLIEICQKIYQEYLEDPTEKRITELRIAYENIPEHERMYVGDMDVKDTAVRMLIYGDQEIENWSHYQVAKNMGSELPSINLPKPKK